MQVVKRNGRIVEFDNTKIKNAAGKAWKEVYPEIDHGKIDGIVQEIERSLKEAESPLHINTIQNTVEKKLMDLDQEVAKGFILYRYEKDRVRDENKPELEFLSDEFLSKYKHREDPLNELGSFVFYRTYSRFLPGEGRRERWWETLARAVNYNMGLSPKSTRKEAEALYDNMYNLKQQLSGRTLFTGGTEASKKFVLSNYNCSYTTIEHIDDFADLFYVLMVGTGAGVGIQKKYTEKLAPFRTDIKVYHEPWEFTPKSFREDITTTEVNQDTFKIIVGDSKEGFVEALRTYLSVLTSHSYRTINNIIFNYNFVRPKGEILKTFGGYASGHMSMQSMIHKIDKLIQGKKKEGTKVNLNPIDVMDIANIIGENVVSGGVRRTAEIVFIDSDDEEAQDAKSNLYTVDENGVWQENREILHRMMSNNSIIYEEKPTREELHRHFEKMKVSGEPGIVNAESARKRRDNFKGLNPCFTGDMKLLTEDGYKTFEELDGKQVDVVSHDGQISKGKVWDNGKKETVRLRLSNGTIIKVTPDHVFMTEDGDEVEAKDTKGKRLKTYLQKRKELDKKFVQFGFIQGDGNLGRLASKEHMGLEVNIGKKDQDIRELFKDESYTTQKRERVIYLNGKNEELRDLGFSSKPLPERLFPTSYKGWSTLEKASFLNGCYSANGSVIKKHRVAYKTTSKGFADQLLLTLEEDFGIVGYITTNKSKKVKFDNGEYQCKESYDVNIGNFNGIKDFAEKIGFYHNYKNESLAELIKLKSPMVTSVKPNGLEKVYDFSEPINHWGVVEGVVAHNCAEILLDSKGVCNLTTMNMMAFVDEEGNLDREGLMETTRLSARAGYRMTNVTLELYNWDRVQKRDRLLGVSMTGYQEMVGAADLTIKEEEDLLAEIRVVANDAMKEIAAEIGGNESLLVTTVKPEGTLSQVFGGVSSGLHFPHSEYYIRRIRISANDPLCRVAEDLGWSIKPEVGQDWDTALIKVIELPVHSTAKKFKKDVTAIDQLEVYKRFQTFYTDHNSSITVHVREDEWDEVEEWVWNNWDEFIGVSFLSFDDSFYKLLPYEETTKEYYEKLKARTKPFAPEMLRKYETTGVSELDPDELCEDGACAVR